MLKKTILSIKNSNNSSCFGIIFVTGSSFQPSIICATSMPSKILAGIMFSDSSFEFLNDTRYSAEVIYYNSTMQLSKTTINSSSREILSSFRGIGWFIIKTTS